MSKRYREVIFRAQSGDVEMDKPCSHLGLVQTVKPSADGCEECLKNGDDWVHLRMCLICGKVGCCDNSKNKHATRHFHEAGHALIMSYEQEDNWLFCYLDQTMIWL